MAKERFKVSTFDPKPLTWWRANRHKIDWDPPYQRRGRLWSDTDKAYLIDSILNDYDIPKLYLADFTWRDSPLNKKQLPYAIIDGKQRFETIFEFFDGKLVLNDDFVYIEDPSITLRGLGYKDLVDGFPEIAEKFDTATLTVMSVFAENEGRINELFVRLNRSKPLTGAEVRNAMKGPAPAIIRSVAKHQFFSEFVRFSVSRGADLNATAKLMLFEFHRGPQETKKRNLDRFVANAAKQRDSVELAARRVADGLENMCEIFLPKDILLTSAGVIPVYYWFIRNVTPRRHSKIRAFLVEFENSRRENRRIAQAEGESSKKIDKQLIEYDRLNRSVNDLQSQVFRCEVLRKRFANWKG